MGSERDVKLKISAVDDTKSGLQSAMRAVAEAQRKLKSSGGNLVAQSATYRAQQSATGDMRVAWEAARAEATRLGKAVAQAEAPSKKLTAQFVAAKTAAATAERAYHSHSVGVTVLRTRLGDLATATRNLAVTQSANPTAALAAQQDRLAVATGRATTAIRAQNAENLRASLMSRRTPASGAPAAGRTAGGGAGGASGFLGLQSHQLANLSYQMNDVVSGLMMGQKPMMILAQQGGQIAQIFPKAIGAIARMGPHLAIVAVAVAAVVTPLMRLNAEAARLDAAEATIKRLGNGANYSAPQLARVAEQMSALGAKADEANAAVSLFVQKAVDPSYLNRFAKAATDTAKVLKIDVADAAEKVTTAFTGNADAVMALDDEVGFLTESERKHIEKLKESKKDAEARTYAFEIFAKKYGAISDDMDGPWKRTLENLKAAWDGFASFVNFIDWTKLKGELSWIANKLAEITAKLPGARNATATATAARIDELRRSEDIYEQRIAKGHDGSREGRITYESNVGARNMVRNERQVLGARLGAQQLVEGTSPITQRPTASDTTTRPPAAANTSTPKVDNSAADAAKRRAEGQREFVASLLEENAARAFQLSLLDETERQQQILTAMREAEAGAAKVGLALTDAQRQSITEGVTRLYDEGKAREAIKVIDQARLELAQQRGEIETRDAFIQRKLAADLLGATEAQKTAYAGMLGQTYDREASLREQAALEKAVTDQERIRAELQQQIQYAQETGDTTRATDLQLQLDGVNTALLTAIQRMRELWITTGGPEAQAALLALDGVERRLKGTGKTALVTGKEVNDAFAGNATSALDSFAQGLAETGDVFGSLRDAFLQFAADFLRQIANMIIQRIIFNAISGGTGSSGGNGGLGGFIAGLFHTGGVVGDSGGASRTVNPGLFVNATRYHTGGVAGLASNEVPAILQRGEEVLTANDARHVDNGGLSAGAGSVKIVNSFDPGDFLDKALATEAGERTFMNFVGRNSGAFKAAMG